MKRRLWAVLLILAMVLSLCACGGKKEEPKEETAKEETKKEEKEEKHQAGDIVGQWKCTSITMDELGTLDSDECKELLGYDMLATISFSGWDAGHCAFSLMEEDEEGEQVTKELAMLWTKENDNYTLTFEDPEASASYSGAAAAFDVRAAAQHCLQSVLKGLCHAASVGLYLKPAVVGAVVGKGK